MEYNEIQKSFNNHERYFSEKVTRNRIRKYERIIQLIEKIKPNKGKLLDVGCGRGEMVYAATKRNWNAVGTEISESFAQYAKDKFDINILVGDINKIKLSEEAFDVVTLSSVIQYIQDPLEELKKINSLLKKDGILYLEVTNENALIFKIGDFFKSLTEGERLTSHLSPLFPSFQIYGFNKKSLGEMLKRSGFKIFYIKIRGITGAGMIRGGGLINKVINFTRKVVVFLGGITCKGHLIYCLAKKG
jgi:ubiquinone/menaquinone biosynthesis C-methylase UbiE